MNKPFPLFKWNESKHLCSQAWKSFTLFCIYATNKIWLLGLCPRSRWGSLQHSPIPPSWAAGGHPSRTFPWRVFLNFIQILHLAVCTLPYIHVYYSGYATAWLSPLITCFAPPQHTTWLRACFSKVFILVSFPDQYDAMFIA